MLLKSLFPLEVPAVVRRPFAYGETVPTPALVLLEASENIYEKQIKRAFELLVK